MDYCMDEQTAMAVRDLMKSLLGDEADAVALALHSAPPLPPGVAPSKGRQLLERLADLEHDAFMFEVRRRASEIKAEAAME